MESVLACHPAVPTEWPAGWQIPVHYDVCTQPPLPGQHCRSTQIKAFRSAAETWQSYTDKIYMHTSSIHDRLRMDCRLYVDPRIRTRVTLDLCCVLREDPPPFEAILVIFGRRSLIFYCLKALGKKWKMTPLLCACAAVITLETQKCQKRAPRSVEFNFFINPLRAIHTWIRRTRRIRLHKKGWFSICQVWQ